MATNATVSLAKPKQILAQRQCSGPSPPRPALYTDLPGLVLPRSEPRARNEHTLEVSSLGSHTELPLALHLQQRHTDSMRTCPLHSKVQSPSLETAQHPPDAILCHVLEDGELGAHGLFPHPFWDSSELMKQILGSGCRAGNKSKQISDSATKLKQQQL